MRVNPIFQIILLLVLSVVLGFGACLILVNTRSINSKPTKYLLWITGILVGFVLAAVLIHYDVLKFDGILTVGNVVQASSTLIVGLLVASYFQRHTHADRKEKDILLKHLDLVLAALEELEQFKDGGVLTKITASLKKLSVQCKSVHDLLVHLEYPKEIISQMCFDEQLKTIRKLASDTPIKKIKEHANTAKCSSTVREGIIQWAQERAALLDSEIQKMKTSILKTEIQINRV